MDALKEFEKDGKGCLARLAYGGYTLLISIVNGIFCIPWLICYYKFIYDLEWRDPYHCWVVEGDYRAYAEAPGIDGEADIGAEFNEWVMFNWYIVLVAVAAPFATAVFACGFPYCVPCGAITALAFIGCVICRIVAFWWAVIIRFKETGFTASGKNISECLAFTDEADAADCSPEGVFMTKTGKLLLAVIIISILSA